MPTDRKEYLKDYMKERRATHPEENYKYVSQWRKNNREAYNAYCREYRAKKKAEKSA